MTRKQTTLSSKADPKAYGFLMELREIAVENQITATEAVRRTIQAMPKVSRIGLKHAAIAAGINPRTARNTFDRVTKAA